MSMSQHQRIPLARHIAALRRDWDLAGIDSALVKLGQTIADPFEVGQIALAAAANPTNRTPVVMTLDGPHRRQTTGMHVATTERACPTHGGTTRRGTNGPWACCWTAQQDTNEHQTERTETSP